MIANWEVPSSDPRPRLSPAGSHVATGHEDGTLRFWKVSAAQSAHINVTFAFPIEGLAFSPGGDRLVVGSEGGEAAIVDVATGTETARLRRHFGAVHSVANSPDGRRILTGGGPGETVKVWDAETHRELITLFEPECWLSQVALSPDGKSVYAFGGAGELHFRTPDQISDVATMQPRMRTQVGP